MFESNFGHAQPRTHASLAWTMSTLAEPTANPGAIPQATATSVRARGFTVSRLRSFNAERNS